ncbi:uncharacterized protein FOMMEDRAFT_171312 [Fomitiporia mediterranea MF3/22]|uniref:uncharacterized protein n=1 Tax=Fomitiporia mediterranea (strain MF3/22) TaxID=694068 RepID=UPI0004407F72|nr:uncharacterized protein FOMMEDRAFT_171312 [Fomitiporia mediterranea MF3/22]EJC97907.1 hypothetical protein FOMMEDRAFT_171312 [Fomitiporia mediterranea MF3/22]
MICNLITRPPKSSGNHKGGATPAVSTPADVSAPQTPVRLSDHYLSLISSSLRKSAGIPLDSRRIPLLTLSVLSQERERVRQDRERRRAEREAALTAVGSGLREVPLVTGEDDQNASMKADGEGMDVDTQEGEREASTPGSDSAVKTMLSVIEEEDVPTCSYFNEGTTFYPSAKILPQKHYCDITGWEAPYTDPTTGLRYHGKSIYEFIKTLVRQHVSAYHPFQFE